MTKEDGRSVPERKGLTAFSLIENRAWWGPPDDSLPRLSHKDVVRLCGPDRSLLIVYGRVLDITGILQSKVDERGSMVGDPRPLYGPLVSAVGSDCSTWFDARTHEVHLWRDEKQGKLVVPWLPMGRFLHVPPSYPCNDWAFPTLPWWKDASLIVAVIADEPRSIRAESEWAAAVRMQGVWRKYRAIKHARAAIRILVSRNRHGGAPSIPSEGIGNSALHTTAEELLARAATEPLKGDEVDWSVREEGKERVGRLVLMKSWQYYEQGGLVCSRTYCEDGKVVSTELEEDDEEDEQKSNPDEEASMNEWLVKLELEAWMSEILTRTEEAIAAAQLEEWRRMETEEGREREARRKASLLIRGWLVRVVAAAEADSKHKPELLARLRTFDLSSLRPQKMWRIAAVYFRYNQRLRLAFMAAIRTAMEQRAKAVTLLSRSYRCCSARRRLRFQRNHIKRWRSLSIPQSFGKDVSRTSKFYLRDKIWSILTISQIAELRAIRRAILSSGDGGGVQALQASVILTDMGYSEEQLQNILSTCLNGKTDQQAQRIDESTLLSAIAHSWVQQRDQEAEALSKSILIGKVETIPAGVLTGTAIRIAVSYTRSNAMVSSDNLHLAVLTYWRDVMRSRGMELDYADLNFNRHDTHYHDNGVWREDLLSNRLGLLKSFGMPFAWVVLSNGFDEAEEGPKMTIPRSIFNIVSNAVVQNLQAAQALQKYYRSDTNAEVARLVFVHSKEYPNRKLPARDAVGAAESTVWVRPVDEATHVLVRDALVLGGAAISHDAKSALIGTPLMAELHMIDLFKSEQRQNSSTLGVPLPLIINMKESSSTNTELPLTVSNIIESTYDTRCSISPNDITSAGFATTIFMAPKVSGELKQVCEQLYNYGLAAQYDRLNIGAIAVEAARHLQYADTLVRTAFESSIGDDNSGTIMIARLLLRKAAQNRPIVLFGDKSTGKSTSIAMAVSRVRANADIILRFCGLTEASAGVRRLACSLLEQLEALDVLDSDERLANERWRSETVVDGWKRWVSSQSANYESSTDCRPRCIILEGAERCSDGNLNLWQWLPRLLPRHINMVITVDGGAEDQLLRLRQVLPRECFIPYVQPKIESFAIMEDWLRRSGKEVTATQRELVQRACSLNMRRGVSFLYLRIVHLERLKWRSFDNITGSFPIETSTLLSAVLHQWKAEFGANLVKNALSMMCIAKHGLSWMELLDCCSAKLEIRKESERLMHVEPNPSATITRLPGLLWERFRQVLHKWLLSPEYCCSGVVRPTQSLVQDLVMQELPPAELGQLHLYLSDYFGGSLRIKDVKENAGRCYLPPQPFLLNVSQHHINVRRVDGEIYHLIQACEVDSPGISPARWLQLQQGVCNLMYIRCKGMLGWIQELKEEMGAVRRLVRLSAFRGKANVYENLRQFQRFMAAHSDELGLHPLRVFQLAVNQPAVTAVAQSARSGVMQLRKDGLENSAVPPVWLECLNLPLNWNPCVQILSAQTNNVLSIDTARDGTRFVSSHADGCVCVWDGDSLQLEHMLEVNTCEVFGISLGKNSIQMFCTGESLSRWDARDGSIEALFPSEDSALTCCRYLYMNDGKECIVAGSEDGSLHMWECATMEKLFDRKSHEDAILAIAVHDSLIVSVACDMTMRLWNGRTGKSTEMYRRNSVMHDCKFSPDGKFVTAACGDSRLFTVRLSDRQEVREFCGHSAAVLCCDISNDGRLLVSGSSDCTVRVWSTEPAVQIRVFSSHTSSVSALALTKDGRTLISGSTEMELRIWDLSAVDIEKLRAQTRLRGYVLKFIVSQRKKRSLEMAVQHSGKLLQHSGPVVSLSFSPDSRLLISITATGETKIWSINMGNLRFLNQCNPEVPNCDRIIFPKEGNTCAIGSISIGQWCVVELPTAEVLGNATSDVLRKRPGYEQLDGDSHMDPLQQLKALWTTVDRDGSGELDLNELKSMCKLMGEDVSMAKTLMLELDTSGDGEVSFEEFSEYILGEREQFSYSNTEIQIRSIFGPPVSIYIEDGDLKVVQADQRRELLEFYDFFDRNFHAKRAETLGTSAASLTANPLDGRILAVGMSDGTIKIIKQHWRPRRL